MQARLPLKGGHIFLNIQETLLPGPKMSALGRFLCTAFHPCFKALGGFLCLARVAQLEEAETKM